MTPEFTVGSKVKLNQSVYAAYSDENNAKPRLSARRGYVVGFYKGLILVNWTTIGGPFGYKPNQLAYANDWEDSKKISIVRQGEIT